MKTNNIGANANILTTSSSSTVLKQKKAYQMHHIAKQIREELTEESDIDITGVDIGSLTWMITQYDIASFDNDEYRSMRDIIPKIISDRNVNQSFSIVDIGAIIRQYRLWQKYLSNVEIFYAVKCNSDPVILRTLASLGVGFDVASNGEINMAIESDVSRDKIIYANPCKRGEHISYARSQNISLMTFDNINELLKVAHLHPMADLVLRIVVDDITKSKMQFGCKFGCPMHDVKELLNFAKFHLLKIVGVSFHVGSACLDPKSYSNSIIRAREVFDIAKEIGYTFNILDIGGGFPGTDNFPDTDNSHISENIPSFKDISEQIQQALTDTFSDVENLRVIAEPGRFFATSTLTHVVRITSKKSIKLAKPLINDIKIPIKENVQDDISNQCPVVDTMPPVLEIVENNLDVNKIFHYYIDSSLYGMFNNLVFDKASVKFQLLNNYYTGDMYMSVIFGETCDSMDKIVEGEKLPELACGDYLYVENHGAYTLASSSTFNGFAVSKPLYIFTF
jgi:ornithine decarboxylase